MYCVREEPATTSTSPQVLHSQWEREKESEMHAARYWLQQLLAFAGVTHDIMSPADSLSWKQTALFLGKLSLTGCSLFLSHTVCLSLSLCFRYLACCHYEDWRDESSLNYTDREIKAAQHKCQVRYSEKQHLQQPRWKTNNLTKRIRRNVSLKHLLKDTFSFSFWLENTLPPYSFVTLLLYTFTHWLDSPTSVLSCLKSTFPATAQLIMKHTKWSSQFQIIPNTFMFSYSLSCWSVSLLSWLSRYQEFPQRMNAQQDLQIYGKFVC